MAMEASSFKKITPRIGIPVLCIGIVCWWVTAQARCHIIGAPATSKTLDTTIPGFLDYQLILAWRRFPPFDPDEPCLLAQGRDGDVLYMPADFNKVLEQPEQQPFSVNSREDALNVARTYVAVSTPFRLIVISSLKMVPGIDKRPHPDYVITGPQVDQSGNEYVVSLFTWKELGGALQKWTILVSADGKVSPHVEELGVHLGDAIGVL